MQHMSMYERLCMVLMSAPATKALSPLPVMTMARISGSASNSSAHAVSSLTKLTVQRTQRRWCGGARRLQAMAEALSGAHVGVSAFSAFGRLSVIRPTPPARVSCKMDV